LLFFLLSITFLFRWFPDPLNEFHTATRLLVDCSDLSEKERMSKKSAGDDDEDIIFQQYKVCYLLYFSLSEPLA
jgi:hypothetical protein